MTKQILKTILAGILAGTALFLMPFFLIRFLLIFLIVGAVIRLMGGRRRFGRRRRDFAFAEKFSSMSDEEKAAFRSRMQRGCGGFDRTKTETPS